MTEPETARAANSSNASAEAASGKRPPWGLIGAGVVAGAAAVGAGLFLFSETSVEQPRYRLVKRSGAIELRDYPALIVAETKVAAPRERALDEGFQRLARYIFAKDRGGKSKIAMTAPVLSDGGGQEWRTRFVMPHRFTREELPTPADDVRLNDIPARRVAAIRFSGVANDAAIYAHERQLRDWIAAEGLTPGRVDYAFYNSPFMPAPLRRNEVMIEVGGGAA